MVGVLYAVFLVIFNCSNLAFELVTFEKHLRSLGLFQPVFNYFKQIYRGLLIEDGLLPSFSEFLIPSGDLHRDKVT